MGLADRSARRGEGEAARLLAATGAGIAEGVPHHRLHRRILRDMTLETVRPIRMRDNGSTLCPLQVAAEAEALKACDAVRDLGRRPVVHAGQPLGATRRRILGCLHRRGLGTQRTGHRPPVRWVPGDWGPGVQAQQQTGREESKPSRKNSRFDVITHGLLPRRMQEAPW